MPSNPKSPRAPSAKLLDDVRAALVDPKNAERPSPALFHDLAIRHGQKLAPVLVTLGAYEPERVHARAITLLLSAAKDPGIAPAVKRRFFDAAAKHALAAIRDAAVSDDRKLTLMSVQVIAGRPLPEEEVRAGLRDYDAAVEKMKRERASELPDSLGAVEGLLEAAGLVTQDDPSRTVTAEQVGGALGFAVEVIRENTPVSVTLLCCAAAVANEHGVAGDTAIEALGAAAATKHPRAAWLLGELARWPASPLTKRARRLAEDLHEAGVTGATARTGAFSHGLALGVDGAGSRSLVLLYKTGDGAFDSLSLLLNDQTGIKDTWCTWSQGAEVESRIREAGLTVAPCDLGHARRLVADALLCHEESGRPIPGRLLLYRSLLGDEAIVPARHVPDLGVYLMETIARGPAIAEGSESLADQGLYGQLWFCSDQAYDFVGRLGRRARGGRPSEALVNELLRVVAREKEVLARRVAINLEVEARAGRAKRPENRMAARTLVAITEGVVAFEKVPYVRALARHAIEAISEALRMGYGSQAEVNADGLDRDAIEGLMNAFGLGEE